MGKRKTTNDKKTISGLRKYRLLPAYLLLSILLFASFLQRTLSGDVWWHLKTGQWILAHHKFPFHDPFSFSATHTVMLHSWGFDVISWLVYRVSPSALAILAVLCMSSAFIIAFFRAIKQSESVFISFITVAIAASAAATACEMRPQVFSFLMFGLVLLILDRFHRRGGKTIWFLPLVLLIWANLHDGVLVGLAVISLEAVVALIAPPDWALEGDRPRYSSGFMLVLVTVVCSLIVLINPNGTGVYTYPFIAMGPSFKVINEWESPSFHGFRGGMLLAVYALAFVGLVRLPRLPKLREFAYFGCFGAVSLMSMRHVPFMAIACAAPIAVWLTETIRSIDIAFESKLFRFLKTTSWIAIFCMVALRAVGKVQVLSQIDAFNYMSIVQSFPGKACDFILANNLKGPIFNDINSGGYLIFRLWPKYKDFADTRVEPFLNGPWEESLDAAKCVRPAIWHRIFDRYDFNTAVLPVQSPLVSVLIENEQWVAVYYDRAFVVFVKAIPEHRKVIENRPK